MDLKKNDYRVLVQEDEDSLTTTGTSSSNKSTLRHNSSNNNSSVLCPSVVNSPISAILAYCGSSILMTVTNKYVLSGYDFNMNFLLLFIQVFIIDYDVNVLKHGIKFEILFHSIY